ncbi:von willebrand factor d and egf domain-containing protein [Lasius niger]|uniref:von willebrand factor d and egf domain-containing protein n=1 Tax=Lasius niger TaxID=67767 RepID=A0A0J7L8N1_LASNI|nr:von willebrand factor d and egf domain-containing protein [Lasius niger]
MDSDGFTCRPVCDEECERNYGYCYEPHVCSCSSGYKRTENSDSTSSTCEPVCDRACTNGYCTAPNVCKCWNGYEVDQFDRFSCVPKCDEICVFGACMAPQMCFCNDGYRAVNASVCEPICSEPCKMGICIAPESCSCNDGYQNRNGNSKYVCEPICETDCGNEKGRYLGSPCDFMCNPELQHVFCDSITGLCECEKFYPVRLGPTKGCAKPKRLGEQCLYRATCTFADQHSTCTQVQHNAVCDCEEGYHRVALSRPNKKVFCAEGSRRPSLASVHSSTSSSRSFSARRLEKERNDKEQRQALQELRLAKQREQLQQQQQQVVPTPSPRTPHSTDELLPSVEEGKEVFYNEVQKSVYISLEMPVISMSIGLFNDDS